MVVGASYESVAARITARNNRTKQLKEAVKNHGKNQRHSELYRKLHHPDTGMLGALGILLALKTSYGARKYTDENYIQPVERIAQMPSLIEQLVEREKSGLSIASLDE